MHDIHLRAGFTSLPTTDRSPQSKFLHFIQEMPPYGNVCAHKITLLFHPRALRTTGNQLMRVVATGTTGIITRGSRGSRKAASESTLFNIDSISVTGRHDSKEVSSLTRGVLNHSSSKTSGWTSPCKNEVPCTWAYIILPTALIIDMTSVAVSPLSLTPIML